jgi:DNA invertase Pin-like site-specific DNA recombinase
VPSERLGDDTTRVAGYIRVSTEQQRDEGSHETQREQLQEWAARHEYDLEVFEDIAISGQSDERPAYDAMMDRLDEFDLVAVRELSRFGRSLQQVLRDIERLDDHGVEFTSITEDFSTDSAMGTAMLQMIGVFNEFWANLARERAHENVQRRRESGEPIGRPRKLSDEQIEQVREWHDMGLGYGGIVPLVEDAYGVEVSETTIYRYCQDSEAEADD